MGKRLEILKNSLTKKEALRDLKINDHFSTVKQANGQPLNDKRNGAATLRKWESQNDVIRKLNESIEVTKRAIEKEEFRCDMTASFSISPKITRLISNGTLVQWRRHPNYFFVKGVEKARIVLQSDGSFAHKYVKNIPTKEQHAIFRDVFNGLIMSRDNGV